MLYGLVDKMRAQEFLSEIKISGLDPKVKDFISYIYEKFPDTFQNNHVMIWGEGDSQELAMFELVPSLSKKNAVELKWFQAYPLRQGIGSRALGILKQLAQDNGISITLYPWDKGQISQSNLIKFYKKMGFRPASKGSKNMIWDPILKEAELKIDVPREEWLQSKIDYAKDRGRDRYGAPYFGATTAVVKGDIRIPVEILKHLKGMRREQENVRPNDLLEIMRIMKDTGKLPLAKNGQEYIPFIMVAYNGEAWVNEGNHRIMAAARLGWDNLPVELKYFDGGERIESGPLYPGKLGLL